MRLYHGTCASRLPMIMERGILPRSGSKRSNWDHSVTSNPNCVYLTSAYAIYFALCASKDGDGPVVLEVETDRLDQDMLVPDEDLMEQGTRGQDDLPKSWTMQRRTCWYRKRLLEYNHAWRVSVENMGNCAYWGTIPPEAITRVATIDGKRQDTLCVMALDPSITIINYRIVGDKYRAMTAWLFGDEFEDPATDAAIKQMQNRPEYYRTLREILTECGRDGITVEDRS